MSLVNTIHKMFKAAKTSVVFSHLAKLCLYSLHIHTTAKHLKWNAAQHHCSQEPTNHFLKQEDGSLKTSCRVNSQSKMWADHWVRTDGIKTDDGGESGLSGVWPLVSQVHAGESMGGSGGPRGHCERVCRMRSYCECWREFFIMQSPVFGQVAGEELTSSRMRVLFVPQLKGLCLIKGLLRG